LGIFLKVDEVRYRFGDLGSRSQLVASLKVIQPNRCLYQSLVKESDRTLSFAPQIFPDFMGLVVAPGVKKKQAIFEQVLVWHGL